MGDLVQTRDLYSDASQEEWGGGDGMGEKDRLKASCIQMCGFFSLLLSSKELR